MGRMSDARKRAQQKKPGSEPPAPEPAPTHEDAAPPAGTEPTAEDAFVFPADEPDEESTPRTKISLPASGLAEDILARAEAASVALAPAKPAPAPAPAPEPPPGPTSDQDAISRAHNISFFAAPAREERKAVEASEHLATFFLAGEEYGIDVRLVQEIIRVTEITHVPRAPEFIKGVINLRGRIIPVVDLKRKLALGTVEMTKQARIVVVKVRERLIGLLVDGASQVLKVPVSSIEAAPEEVVEIDANCIRGVAKLADRLIILVDLHKVLAQELREGLPAESA